MATTVKTVNGHSRRMRRKLMRFNVRKKKIKFKASYAPDLNPPKAERSFRRRFLELERQREIEDMKEA